jgi:hypothetical protein
MKTPPPHGPRRREHGMATIVFIALLGIMMILVMAESRSLFHLHQEVKYWEQKQVKRLSVAPATAPITATNSIAGTGIK